MLLLLLSSDVGTGHGAYVCIIKRGTNGEGRKSLTCHSSSSSFSLGRSFAEGEKGPLFFPPPPMRQTIPPSPSWIDRYTSIIPRHRLLPLLPNQAKPHSISSHLTDCCRCCRCYCCHSHHSHSRPANPSPPVSPSTGSSPAHRD